MYIYIYVYIHIYGLYLRIHVCMNVKMFFCIACVYCNDLLYAHTPMHPDIHA